MPRSRVSFALAIVLTLAVGSLLPAFWPTTADAPSASDLPDAEPPATPDTDTEEPAPTPLDVGPGAIFLVDGCTAEVTCSSGHTISCSADPGETCGSNPGWDVWCGSCSLNCTAINAWQSCRDACDAAYFSCLGSCDGTRTGCIHCSENRLDCVIACGSKPATTCSG